MSKLLVIDGVTEDTMSQNIEFSHGGIGVFVTIGTEGAGRVSLETTANGGLTWMGCRERDGSDAVFTSTGYHELENHGGNTMIRVIVDQTNGSTTPITVYLTIED